MGALVSAQTIPNNCGIQANLTFNNFFGEITSKIPLVYPKNDKELATILKAARDHRCRVRVRGTGHSANGIVAQKTEKNTVVVSMAEYRSNDKWSNVLDINKKTVRMDAGRTFLDLYSVIRPAGYLLPAQTAGWYFSLGGVFMNPSVHGGTRGQGHLMEQVVGIRAMLANGRIVEITNEKELEIWRGSMGLLGVVTSLEVTIVQDQGHTQLGQTVQPADFNRSTIEGLVLGDFYKNNDINTIFIDVYTNTFYNAAGNLTGSTNAPATEAQYKEMYSTLITQNPNLAITGSPLAPPQANPANFVKGESQKDVGLAAFLAGNTGSSVLGSWVSNGAAGAINDMFYLGGIFLPYQEVSYFFPVSKMYDAVSVLRNTFLKLAADPNRPVALNTPITIRFIEVKSARKSIWQALPVGKYVAVELIHIADPEVNTQNAVFAEVEAQFLQLGGIPHQGKGYGSGKVTAHPELPPLPTFYQFQDLKPQNSIYSLSSKFKCQKAMLKYDPIGLFRGGASLQTVGWPFAPIYEVRKFNGERCTFGDGECLSGKCVENVCVA
jgi:hypothetical protein